MSEENTLTFNCVAGRTLAGLWDENTSFSAVNVMYNGTKYSLTRAGFDAKLVLTEHVYRFFGAVRTTNQSRRAIDTHTFDSRVPHPPLPSRRLVPVRNAPHRNSLPPRPNDPLSSSPRVTKR